MSNAPEQQIRERLQTGDYRLTAVPEIHTLLARIDELTAERDEAEANIGEVNQLLADTLSRTKSAEQQVERLTADLAAANASIEHLRTRVREQTAATQEAYANHEADIRKHLEGIVELGDSSCPIWQRVASAVATLTAEREAIAKYIGYEWSPGSHYDLPEGVKDFVAGEVQSALIAANQRAADAARVERERWATWLRQQARELDVALETALVTTNAYAALHTERAVLINAADAIQRNEHKNPST